MQFHEVFFSDSEVMIAGGKSLEAVIRTRFDKTFRLDTIKFSDCVLLKACEI